MMARPLRIAPSILPACIMFPYMGSGLDAILKHSHIGLFSPLTGAILNPNAVPRCEHNDKTGNRIPFRKFPHRWPGGNPFGYVSLFPPILRPTLVKIDLLHLEAFCLAEF